MERREVLKIGLATGATLVAEQLGQPVEAKAKKVVAFHQGDIANNGGPLEGFGLLIAVTSKTVRGTIYDIASLQTNDWEGFRVRGEVNGTKITFKIFALEDLAFANPFGSFAGAKSGASYEGDFTLDGAAAGSVTMKSFKHSAKMAKKLTGNYWLYLRDPNDINLQGGGKFVVSNRQTFSGTKIEDFRSQDSQVPSRGAGRWLVTASGEVLAVVLLPDLTGVNLVGGIKPSEVYYAKVSADNGVIARENNLTGHIPGRCCFCTCFGSC